MHAQIPLLDGVDPLDARTPCRPPAPGASGRVIGERRPLRTGTGR